MVRKAPKFWNRNKTQYKTPKTKKFMIEKLLWTPKLQFILARFWNKKLTWCRKNLLAVAIRSGRIRLFCTVQSGWSDPGEKEGTGRPLHESLLSCPCHSPSRSCHQAENTKITVNIRQAILHHVQSIIFYYSGDVNTGHWIIRFVWISNSYLSNIWMVRAFEYQTKPNHTKPKMPEERLRKTKNYRFWNSLNVATIKHLQVLFC